MIKRFLSRYAPSYPKTLVYMLQESEYSPQEYLAWLNRTRDFRQVAVRKQLKMTTKARSLLVMAWLITAIVYLITLEFLIFLPLALSSNPYLLVLIILEFWAAPSAIALLLLVPVVLGEILIQKPRELQIIGQAKRKLAIHPGTKIVIAGSFGKTTFKDILATVLSEGKKVAATPGNYNTPLGIAKFVSGLSGDEEVLIIEAGEYYPGDIAKICQLVDPDMGVITGVNQAHLARFKTIERAVDTVFELADYLGKKSLWVNGESELAAARRQGSRYTRDGVSGWKVSKAATGLDGTDFIAAKDNKTITATTRLLGLHQIGPLVACIDIATDLGLSPKQIEAGIAKTVPFEHRMQPREDGGVIMIDDTYNGNPDGFKAGIEFLSSLKGHRRIYVTPGIVELGAASAEIHHEIGRMLAVSDIEMVVLVKDSATPFIEEGLKAGNYPGEIKWYPDGLSSLKALPNLTVRGDVVMLQNDWSDSHF